jgi:hypothetical protein
MKLEGKPADDLSQLNESMRPFGIKAVSAKSEEIQKPKRERKTVEYKGLTAPMCLYLLGLKLYPYPQLQITSKEIKAALAWHYSQQQGGN